MKGTSGLCMSARGAKQIPGRVMEGDDDRRIIWGNEIVIPENEQNQ